MNLPSFLLKAKAMKALRGNWQSALLVTFFAECLLLLMNLLQPTILVDPNIVDPQVMMHSLQTQLYAIPTSTWVWFGVVSLLAGLITPVLELGANHYFVSRLQGEELGFLGLFSRMRHFFKAFGLFLYMGVKVLLWSLLLVIPGVIAMIRYSMAPYYLAQDPSLSIVQAVEKSKAAMQTHKMDYFMVKISFVGWMMVCVMTQYLLAGVNIILALVVYQFLSLFFSTYLRGTLAAFFLAVSEPVLKTRQETENDPI